MFYNKRNSNINEKVKKNTTHLPLLLLLRLRTRTNKSAVLILFWPQKAAHIKLISPSDRKLHVNPLFRSTRLRTGKMTVEETHVRMYSIGP